MSKKITLSENAQLVAESRYFMEGENWEDCARRVAQVAATPELQKLEYTDKFAEMITNMSFLPGGRILRNCGRPRGSLFNCYVLPIGDSIEEIGNYFKESLILWSEGGGVGCNFSQLRPKGDPILGKGGQSSGLVSFLEASNAVAKTIESGGARRAAALACVDVSHPEVIDFINAKVIDERIKYYNISVGINNDFIEAVERNTNWQFKFKHRIYGEMPAREIWDLIVDNMLKCAEPGLINFSNLSKNNSYYYEPITSTNPCGELPLPNYGVCCLGSLVLPNFITGNINTNWKKLENVIQLAVRFLDNIIDVNKYVLKENDIRAHNSRRIGLGVMGLAEYLFAKQCRYGSEKAINEIEKLFRFIRDCAYQTSMELAVEKGAFPMFDPIQYTKASFVRKLPASLRMDIKTHGIRNVTLLSMAPTGTISLIPEVTGGIEPLFSKACRRDDFINSRIYIHSLYKELLQNEEAIPDWFVDAFDLDPSAHFETQGIIQKYVDCAISKTINLRHDITKEELHNCLIEYIKDLKGVTVYVDGSRDGQILNRILEEEAKDILKNNNIDVQSHLIEDDIKCSTGSCNI